MDTPTLYGIRNCDTMKKARAWLDRHQFQYTFHDYQRSGIDAATLQRWSAQLGWEVLLNRAGTTFRKLPDAQRQHLTAARAMALMLAQSSMIRRPVLDRSGALTVGFTPQLYARLFADGGP